MNKSLVCSAIDEFMFMICTEVTSGLRSGAKFMFFINDMPTTCFFPQVKVQTWIDGTEDAEFVGVGARFGRRIVSKEKNANQTHVVFANPRDCCSPLKTKVYSCDLVISALCDAETEYLSFPIFVSLLEMLLLWTGATVGLQLRLIMRKLLVPLLY